MPPRYMQMIDDLLIVMGHLWKKGNSLKAVGNTIREILLLFRIQLFHYWSQILADIKTTQARKVGTIKALPGHTLRGPGV